MYKDLGSMIITGSTGTGKTVLMQHYIEEVLSDNKKIIIVDPKRVEHFKYKDRDNVTYIYEIKDLEEIVKYIETRDSKERLYLFIDEYAEVKYNKELHSKIKNLIKNKLELNIVIVLSSQLKASFCNGMKGNIDSVLHLNRHFY